MTKTAKKLRKLHDKTVSANIDLNRFVQSFNTELSQQERVLLINNIKKVEEAIAELKKTISQIQ